MNNYLWVALFLIFFSSLMFIFILHEKMPNDKMRRFPGRKILSIDEIYEHFFRDSNISKEIITKIWKELAETLELPAGVLRPADSFDKELAPSKFNEFDDPVGLIPHLLEIKFKKAGMLLPDSSKMKTIQDYVITVAKLIK